MWENLVREQYGSTRAMFLASSVARIQPLCAAIMLRMSHAQLLAVMFLPQARDEPGDEESDDEDQAHCAEDDSHDEGEEAALEPDGCGDPAARRDFAALRESEVSIDAVFALACHMETCDTCKFAFASMVEEVRETVGVNVSRVH